MPCNCEAGPECEYHYCGKPATWSAMVPSWRISPPLFVPKFFCDPCLKLFRDAWNRQMKGIDRPAHADEEWRPSLSDHLNWARVDMAQEERRARDLAARDQIGNVVVQDWEIKMRGWTLAQIETVKRLRFLSQKYAHR